MKSQIIFVLVLWVIIGIYSVAADQLGSMDEVRKQNIQNDFEAYKIRLNRYQLTDVEYENLDKLDLESRFSLSAPTFKKLCPKGFRMDSKNRKCRKLYIKY